MKRISAILCAVSLLLTLFAACDNSPAATTQPTTRAEAQTTAAPATQTETLPPETTPPETYYQANGSTTAGGITVYTDYSAYEPSAGSGVKFTRLREGPLDTFEPSDDYGGVYPYAASRVYISDEDGNAWEFGHLYGFADRNGCILTDGIFVDVEPMVRDDYMTGEFFTQPFWITSRYDNPVVHYEEEWNYKWVEADRHCGVISMDGSLALPDDYVYVEPLSEGFVCTRDRKDRIMDVYDGQGRFCFSTDQVMNPGDDVWDISYGDGLYLLASSVYYSGYGMKDEGWFLDREGNRVLGPYTEAEAFREGLACVSLDGEKYGFIDKTGKMVIEPEYRYPGAFRDGVALMETQDGRWVLLDKAGNRLLEFPQNSWVNLADCGIRAEYNNGTAAFFSLDGTVLAQGNNDLSCLDEDTFYTGEGDKTKIFRTDGTELIIDKIDWMSPAAAVLDGEVVLGYRGEIYDNNTGRFCFVRRDLSAWYPNFPEKGTVPGQANYYYSSSIQDQLTGEIWYLAWAKDGWIIVKADGTQARIPLQTADPVLRGDRIMGLTNRACIYLDLEGNVVFSYPLDAED